MRCAFFTLVYPQNATLLLCSNYSHLFFLLTKMKKVQRLLLLHNFINLIGLSDKCCYLLKSAVMHDLHLIHTDLKPENILLVSADYIKVLDYKVMPFLLLL